MWNPFARNVEPAPAAKFLTLEQFEILATAAGLTSKSITDRASGTRDSLAETAANLESQAGQKQVVAMSKYNDAITVAEDNLAGEMAEVDQMTAAANKAAEQSRQIAAVLAAITDPEAPAPVVAA